MLFREIKATKRLRLEGCRYLIKKNRFDISEMSTSTYFTANSCTNMAEVLITFTDNLNLFFAFYAVCL